jgi:hypothetical protein
MRLLPAFAVAVLGAAALAACEPACDVSCRKVRRCEITPTPLTLEECEASCVFQEQRYEDAGDTASADAFADHKRCLQRSSCEEIAAGACYDADVFTF